MYTETYQLIYGRLSMDWPLQLYLVPFDIYRKRRIQSQYRPLRPPGTPLMTYLQIRLNHLYNLGVESIDFFDFFYFLFLFFFVGSSSPFTHSFFISSPFFFFFFVVVVIFFFMFFYVFLTYLQNIFYSNRFSFQRISVCKYAHLRRLATEHSQLAYTKYECS